MKTQNNNHPSCRASENKSEKLLLEKMGISYLEFLEVKNMYGVDSKILLKLLQVSKYSYVFPGNNK